MTRHPLDVWVVDDDQSVRWVLEKALKQADMEPRSFERAEHLLSTLPTERTAALLRQLEPEVRDRLLGALPTADTVILGVALALVAIGICYDALHRMRDPELLGHQGMLALLVALVLAIVPYVLLRGPVNRLLRGRSRGGR